MLCIVCRRKIVFRAAPSEAPSASAAPIGPEAQAQEETSVQEGENDPHTDSDPDMRDDAYGRRLAEALSTGEHPNSHDLEAISRAFWIARRAHTGQTRLTGEDYVSHPVEVAVILHELGMDTDCLLAGLLHDVVEDTALTAKEVRQGFGENVATLVESVTKLGEIPYTDKEEEQVENLRKMFLATAKDIRVIIIKLADRLHNMRTMDAMPDAKRRAKSRETMEVYAPLAHRLGMQRVKVELEDLSIRYLDPIGYAEIEREFASKREEHQRFLDEAINRISARVNTEFPGSQVTGRIKHVYSVYQKMFMQNKTLNELYDLYAARIIVESTLDCYNALGAVHDIFKPIPGKFKDYISMPKPNMYQSLHTTVMGTSGYPLEVQIRTWEMHRVAEYGVAAHWKYKRGMTKRDALEDKLEWVRRMLDVQQTSSDPEEFMRSLKIDLFDDEVFVFTPRGDLINLPTGATVIDFAYAIHTEVGHRMVGAKAHGKIVPLEYTVQNGDIIEVLTTREEGKGPSRDWLNIAATSEAKSKIRQWFKREKRDENIQRGKEEVERALRSQLITITSEDLNDMLAAIARRLGITGVEELFASIGFGGTSIGRVIGKVKEEYARRHKPSDASVLEQLAEQTNKQRKKSTGGIVVEGLEGCLVKFAHCCSPLPGDDIVGYVTKGYGVSVHRRACRNYMSAVAKNTDMGRWVAVYWDDDIRSGYQTELRILAGNRNGLLADLTGALAHLKVPIRAINARDKNMGNGGEIHVVVEVLDVEHLSLVISRLVRVKGVTEVLRNA